MCLDFGVPTTKPKKKKGIGYKSFLQRRGKLFGDCMRGIKPRPIGKWIHEANFRPFPETIPDYGAGFHVFTTKKGILNWEAEMEDPCIWKVAYRKAVAEGRQEGHRCIIAEEIKILERL